MLYVGLGQADGINTKNVVQLAIDQCRQQLKGKTPQAGIVFAGPHFDYDLMLSIINDSFPSIELIGCSTGGNFSSLHGVGDDAVTLTLFASDKIFFKAGVGREVSSHPEKAARQAVQSALGSGERSPSLCLAFPYGFPISCEPVMACLNRQLGQECPVFGGVSGTFGSDSSEIVQFYGQEILTDSLPVMFISGPVQYSFSIANSWIPVGKPVKAQTDGARRVFKLGDKSAVDFYRHYLGYHEEPSLEFVLAVTESDNRYFITPPVDYHDDDSITFWVSIPDGAEVQLTEINRAQLVRDTRETAGRLKDTPRDWNPALALNFSCAVRKTILGTSVNKEMETLQQSFFPVPLAGFFSYGEISPLVTGGPSRVHGATLITLLLGPGVETAWQQGEPLPSATEGPDERDPSYIDYLKRKLRRSEVDRKQLEHIKELTERMHLQMMREVEEARQQIQLKEEQLQESEEKFRRIVRTSGEGFILMDESLKIIDANSAFCSLVRTRLDSVINESLMDFVVPEQRMFFSSELSRLGELRQSSSSRFEGALMTKDMEKVPVLVNSNLLHKDTGELIGHMAFLADLTEQKKALELAAEVQKSLLPQRPPQISGLDIAARSVSCDEVGGDYYDFFLQHGQTDRALSIAVGDITGHGVDAALLMSSARAFLRMQVAQEESIAEVVTSMNTHLTDDTAKTGRFMSLFYLCIQPDQKTLEWVRAGHDPAILFQPEKERFLDLKGSGLVLGVDPQYKYTANTRENLQAGDVLAVGTDGIWETSNSQGEMFGMKRFKMLLQHNHHLPAADILEMLFQKLEEFRQGRKAADDVTLVIIKIGEGQG